MQGYHRDRIVSKQLLFCHSHHAAVPRCLSCISGSASTSSAPSLRMALQTQEAQNPITASGCICGGVSHQNGGRRGWPTGADADGWRGIDEIHGAIQSRIGFCRWAVVLPSLIPPTSAQDGRATPGPHPRERTLETSQVTHGGRYFGPNPAHHASEDVPGRRPSKSEVSSHACSQWRPNASSPSAEPATHPTQVRARLRWLCVSTAAIYPVRPIDTQCCPSCRPPFAITSVIAPAHLNHNVFRHSGDHEPSLNS